MRNALTMDYERVARRALKDVCSGRDPAGIAEVYHPQFVDHVNALDYRGTDGARQSVALIVEDWACSDTLDLAGQLGAWRSMLLIAKHHKLLRARRSPVGDDAVAPTRDHESDGAGRGR